MRDRLFLSGIGIVSFLVLLSVGFILLGRNVQTTGDFNASALPALNAFPPFLTGQAPPYSSSDTSLSEGKRRRRTSSVC